ncbi:MAG: hypothetical protein WC965_06035 [Thiohalomonadaceae bacterium]
MVKRIFQGRQITPALIQALIEWILRLFTIPWQIWKGAAYRLAEKRRAGGQAEIGNGASEFPVFDWFRNAWDGAIFLSWFFGVVVAAIALFGIDGTTSAVIMLVYTYFGVILMSLLKESLIIMLSIAMNVEHIAKKKEAAASES